MGLSSSVGKVAGGLLSGGGNSGSIENAAMGVGLGGLLGLIMAHHNQQKKPGDPTDPVAPQVPTYQDLISKSPGVPGVPNGGMKPWDY